MDYRLIALDLDGTLLHDDCTISDYTKTILRRCQEAGAIVTISTGRMYASARPFALELGLEVPLITSHGALIKYADGRELAHYLLDQTIALEIYQLMQPYHAHIRCYTTDQLYMSDLGASAMAYARHIGITPQLLPADLSALHPTKLAVVDIPERITQYEALLRDRYTDAIYMTKVSEGFLEISHPLGTKGIALANLAQHFAIPQEQVIAFGDSYNDLPMLQYAGCSVAMGNANDTVKAIADRITDTNENDGVGKLLEQLL